MDPFALERSGFHSALLWNIKSFHVPATLCLRDLGSAFARCTNAIEIAREAGSRWTGSLSDPDAYSLDRIGLGNCLTLKSRDLSRGDLERLEELFPHELNQ